MFASIIHAKYSVHKALIYSFSEMEGNNNASLTMHDSYLFVFRSKFK